jgi:predicted RNA polymerase sigma factor
MTQDLVQRIEDNIAKAKSIVEFDKALQRLEENRDFRKVIRDGYLRDDAVRLVHLKADPAFQTPERQAMIIQQIDAIGQLLQYFRTVAFNANLAMKAVESDEAERDELMAEGVGHV